MENFTFCAGTLQKNFKESFKKSPEKNNMVAEAIFFEKRIFPYLNGSNINEVVKTVLNFLLFFYEKILQIQKSTKPFTANNNKTMRIKNI